MNWKGLKIGLVFSKNTLHYCVTKNCIVIKVMHYLLMHYFNHIICHCIKKKTWVCFLSHLQPLPASQYYFFSALGCKVWYKEYAFELHALQLLVLSDWWFSTPSVCVCVFSSKLKPRCRTLLKLVTSIVTQMELPGRKLMDCRTVTLSQSWPKNTLPDLSHLYLWHLWQCVVHVWLSDSPF